MSDGGIDRRTFLRGGAAAGLAWLGGAADAAETPRVRRRVALGRTGLEVPDIGFGSSRLAGDEELVKYALERGVTYFDSAESYTGGQAEETLGRALAGQRQKVVLTSKVMAGPKGRREKMMSHLEASLGRQK